MAKYNLTQTGARGEIKDTKIPGTILRAITWHTISIESKSRQRHNMLGSVCAVRVSGQRRTAHETKPEREKPLITM
jgi:hypothetical protein